MAYSKMRGARKRKEKKEENKEIAENDLFQQEGKRIFDRVLSHPWFVGGTVVTILVIVIISIFISKQITNANGDKSLVYNSAQKILDATVGENEKFKTEADKLNAVITEFKKVEKTYGDSFISDVAKLYEAQAYYKLGNCEKAIPIFKAIQNSSNTEEDMKFGAFQGESFCYSDKGDYKKADSVLAKYLETSSKKSIYKPVALYTAAKNLIKAEEKDKAYKLIEELINDYDNSLIALTAKSEFPEVTPKKDDTAKKG